jgi:hypothetical protein
MSKNPLRALVLSFFGLAKMQPALLLSRRDSLSLEGEISHMSDLIKDRELEQNKHRVALNLLVLLDIGLFPGKHALGLEECKGFVKAIMEDAQAKLQAMVPPPAPAPAAPPAAA